MSASVLPYQRELADRAGVDAFLGKPYRPSDLTTMLAAVARTRAGHGETEESAPS